MFAILQMLNHFDCGYEDPDIVQKKKKIILLCLFISNGPCIDMLLCKHNSINDVTDVVLYLFVYKIALFIAYIIIKISIIKIVEKVT